MVLEDTTRFLRRAGYAHDNILTPYRFTARMEDGRLDDSNVDLAAFSRPPFDASTACITLARASSRSAVAPLLSTLRFLGAPAALISVEKAVELHAVQSDGRPKLLERADATVWQDQFENRLHALSPEALTKAKFGQTQELDFDATLFPWVRTITETTLTTLLEQLLTDALRSLSPSYQAKPAAQRAVIRIVFHLFACRVLESKGVTEPQATPRDALRAAHNRFSTNIDPTILDSHYLTKSTINQVYSELRQHFSFTSISPEMLGHAYENALVSPTLRRERGVYYTPAAIAEYVLERLPIEGIPEADRIVLDPCCGSGSFLTSAFTRLAHLLADESWTPYRRHQYLRARIIGSDIDDFAREISSLSLLLLDVENRNGWKLVSADARTLVVDDIGKRPTIIVTNPPFREIKESGVRSEKSAEITIRLLDLLPPQGLLGVVMPQSVLDSSAAKTFRKHLLQRAELLELTTFPGIVFKSAADSVLVLARRHDTPAHTSSVTVRELRAKDYTRFRTHRFFTRTYSCQPRPWLQDDDAAFVISPFVELWHRIEKQFPPIRKIAQIKNGLQIKPDDHTSVSDLKRAGDVPFVDRLDALRPFILLSEVDLKPTRWLRYGEHLHRKRSRDIFQGPKVLINSNRNPGSSWRLVAAVSKETLFYSDNFHGVLPTGDTSVEEIAAVLNSPIANAWFDAHSRKRKIVQKTLSRLPFPSFESSDRKRVISLVERIQDGLVRKYGASANALFTSEDVDEDAIALLFSQLDLIVYRAYGATLAEQSQLSKYMAVDKRPGM